MAEGGADDFEGGPDGSGGVRRIEAARGAKDGRFDN